MANNLPALLLPAEWSAMLLSLDDATLSSLIRAGIRYANSSDKSDQSDGSDGAGTEAMGLKSKAAPLWMIMRAEIDRQILHHGRVSAGARKAASVRWSTTKCERMRTHANACERMRTHNPDQKGEINGENDRYNTLTAGNIMRTHANACERMRTDTREGGRAPDVRECGTVQNNILKKKEKLTKRKEKDFDLFGKKKPERPERIKAVLMYYLAKHYHRRKTTRWSEAELRKLRYVSLRPEVLRELRTIGRAYRGGYEYARHDIVTLLNNWTVELDRAENFNKTKGGRNGGGIGKRYGMQ